MDLIGTIIGLAVCAALAERFWRPLGRRASALLAPSMRADLEDDDPPPEVTEPSGPAVP